MRLILRGMINIVAWFLPWPARRWLFQAALGWSLDKTSRISWSVVLADKVVLKAHARIAHGNLVSPIGLLELGPHATIGRGNRIVGAQKTNAYSAETDRRSALVLGEHAALTRDHLVDCTNTVTIGRFSIFAGYRSQILSHSPDFFLARQTSRPVHIGAYCFVGTGSIVLFGATIPDYCIVSAGSVVTKSHDQTYQMYGGNPARPIKDLAPDLAFFTRTVGRLGD